MLLRIAVVFALFAALSGSAAEDSTVYELRFWPGKGVERDPRYVSTADHPCGKVVVARVYAMPPVEPKSALVPERVLEVDSSGKVIRRWPMPVDASPIALRGTRLLVETGELKFWITPQGAIIPYGPISALPAPEPVSCSHSAEFGDSDYVQCRKFRDLSSGKDRIVSFEGPCS